MPGKTDQVRGVVISGTRLDRLTENEPKATLADGTELGGGRQPEIDLQRVWEHERPVDRGPGAQVEVVQRTEFTVDELTPVADHVVHHDTSPPFANWYYYAG